MQDPVWLLEASYVVISGLSVGPASRALLGAPWRLLRSAAPCLRAARLGMRTVTFRFGRQGFYLPAGLTELTAYSRFVWRHCWGLQPRVGSLELWEQ